MAKLYFYYSAMNAGKSTTLLQSSYNYRERGMNTLIFSPKLDDRYGIGRVTSRIGLKSSATIFDTHFNFFHCVAGATQSEKIHCVLIDEAQFLTKQQVLQLTTICDKLSIPVLTYGIRSDFQGEPFPGSQYLLTWADELAEIKTICHCGKKASMNMRTDKYGNKVTEGSQIAVGGNELYVATCRRHFNLGESQALINPTGTVDYLAEN